jgi:hypothetical protein
VVGADFLVVEAFASGFDLLEEFEGARGIGDIEKDIFEGSRAEETLDFGGEFLCAGILLTDQGGGKAVSLAEDAKEDVLRFDGGMQEASGLSLGMGENAPGLAGEGEFGGKCHGRQRFSSASRRGSGRLKPRA